MITSKKPSAYVNWSKILEGRPATFQLTDGSITQIEIEGLSRAQEVQQMVATAVQQDAAASAKASA